MKKVTKFLAAVMALFMICGMMATTALATEAELTSEPVVIDDGTYASGTDTDTAVSASDPMLGIELVDCNLKEYGVRISLPKLSNFLTTDSDPQDALTILGTESVVDEGLLIYTFDDTQENVAYVQFNSTARTREIASYDILSEEQLNAQVSSFNTLASSYSLGTLESLQAEEINGKTVLRAHYTTTDEETGTIACDVIKTVQNGVEYTFLIRFGGLSTTTGEQRYDDVISSIEFTTPKLGFGYQGDVTRDAYTFNLVLLIVAILLFILCLFLLFFLYRFSVYQKAAGSPFNIFGFDMPEKAIVDDDDGDGLPDEDDDGDDMIKFSDED